MHQSPRFRVEEKSTTVFGFRAFTSHPIPIPETTAKMHAKCPEPKTLSPELKPRRDRSTYGPKEPAWCQTSSEKHLGSALEEHT